MICELCGNDFPRLTATLIEESVLEVCPKCARYGVPQKKPSIDEKLPDKDFVTERLEKRERRQKGRDIYTQMTNELIEDYDKVIRKGREKKGLDQKKLARMIQEKKSIIAKLETRSMRPSDRLIRKLETALDVKLTENVKVTIDKRSSPGGAFTIGDLIMMKMKEKKK